MRFEFQGLFSSIFYTDRWKVGHFSRLLNLDKKSSEERRILLDGRDNNYICYNEVSFLVGSC